MLIALSGWVFAQLPKDQLLLDSLNAELRVAKNDSNKLYLSYTMMELKREMKISVWDSLSHEAKKKNLPVLEAEIYNNIGFILNKKGEVLKALDYYHKGLKIQEELNNKTGMASALNNIGVLHDNLGDSEKAMTFYRRSLALAKELNLESMGDRYWNMSTLFPEKSDSSIYYLRLAGDEYYKVGGDYGLGSYHFVLGAVQSRNQLYEISNDHFQQAAVYYRNMNHINYVARSYKHIAENYMHLKKYSLAEQYADSTLALSKNRNALGIVNASEVLYQVYLQRGDYKDAFNMYQLHVEMKDSINNMKILASSIRQNMSYEYEKEKAIRESEHLKELALNKEKEKRQTVILISSIIGLILVLSFAMFVLNRLKLTRQQKDIIEHQKQEVMDSIAYAKRIQSAILPPTSEWDLHLPNSFVLYKPKDIVAGDFYWMEAIAPPILPKGEEQRVSSKTKVNEITPFPLGRAGDGLILFAAADCTGHGVPGAMVSVVCHNALNRSVREYGLTDPGEILTKTREIVIEEFEKSEEDVKDGMDIALCSLQLLANSCKIKYAGAHNPLWIVRDCHTEPVEVLDNPKASIFRQAQDDTLCIIEVKANKQPIGKCDNPEPYTTHTFELEPGDSIYIFSDGYVDQFGGEKGKKFKAKAFRELLLSIQDKSMEEQKQMIDEAFENWRGSLEQIDDVCVIGVKI